MKTLRNLKEHQSGLVNCEILIGDEWHPHSIEANEEYELHESSESQDIKPCQQSEKDSFELEQKTLKDNQDALSYLASTDWYVVRKMDTGAAIPNNIIENRAAARAKII